jgi:hypothetical protein
MGGLITIAKRDCRHVPAVSTLLLICAFPFLAFSNVINVPDDYPTITEGVNHAQDYDTVLVAPGVYIGMCYIGTNESPAGVTLMGSGWPGGTVVTGAPCAEQYNAFEISRVFGWRVTNFEITQCGDAINIGKVIKMEIDHNYMHGTKLAYWSCAIEGDSLIQVSIHHNLASDCDFVGFMLWGYSGDQTGVHVYNNTIDNIHGFEGIQLRCGVPQYCVITNNIITNCGGQGVEFALCDQGNNEVSYNCIFETAGPWENVPHPGPGNIFDSPQYVMDPSIPEYYYLNEDSPCIDTGNPNPFYNDPNGSRSDMGAFPSDEVYIRLEIGWVTAFPGDLVDVPITISDVSNRDVVSAELTITYPDDDLELIRVSIPDTSMPYQAGWRLDYSNPAGSIVASLDGSTPLSGSGLLAVMSFLLDENVLPDSVWNIRFESAVLNHGAYEPHTTDGGIRLPSEILYGDVNLNGHVTLVDASMLFDYLTGTVQLSPLQRLVAEVSGLAGITSFDGALITQYCFGQFELFPVEGGFVETYAEGQLAIPEITGNAGEDLDVFVNIESAINVAAVQLDVTVAGTPVTAIAIRGPDEGAWFPRLGGTYPEYEIFLGGSEPLNGNQECFRLTFQIPDTASGAFSIELTNIMLNETEMPGQVFRNIVVQPTGVFGEGFDIPRGYSLAAAYPNPFNPSTNLVFAIPHTSPVSLKIYNSLGQVVDVLESETLPAGEYTRVWDASRFSSGIYIAEFVAGDFRQCHKLLLIK